MLIAIRDAESRTRFLGYRVENYKTFVFTLSACMAGVAGALYVPQVGIINPSEFAPANSIEVVIWVAVGGRGTLVGAALGAVLVNYAKTTFTTGLLAPYWLFALGALFVLVTHLPAEGHRRACCRSGQRAAKPTAHRPPGAPPSRRSEAPWTPPSPADAEVTQSLLYLDGVSVTFDGFRAINNLSLELAPGEMRAIIGPNGAGKTTMMDIITGKTKPDSGDVLFDRGAIDLTTKDEAAIAQLGIGRKFQKPTVFENHTVEDNMLLALKGDRSVLAQPVVERGGRRTRSASTRSSAPSASPRTAHRLAGSLSHGQKQWLEIGMLIAQDPKLLLVDEPVAGMTDAETDDHRRAAASEIAKDHSVVVVEHDMEFVRRLGVKVTVLHEGSVLAEGSIDEVSANERVVEVYLGR